MQMKKEKSRENVGTTYKAVMECRTEAVNLLTHYLGVELTAALIVT